VEFLQRGLAANGARTAWLEADRFGHHTTVEAVVIQV
jgi:hypothetical protein